MRNPVKFTTQEIAQFMSDYRAEVEPKLAHYLEWAVDSLKERPTLSRIADRMLAVDPPVGIAWPPEDEEKDELHMARSVLLALATGSDGDKLEEALAKGDFDVIAERLADGLFERYGKQLVDNIDRQEEEVAA